MLCKLKAPANRATCWPTFGLDLNVDQYIGTVLYTIFFQGKSNQHSWIFIHSLVDYLSRMSECEAAACLIIALMIDNDGKKTVAQQESGYREERRKRCMPTLFRSY